MAGRTAPGSGHPHHRDSPAAGDPPPWPARRTSSRADASTADPAAPCDRHTSSVDRPSCRHRSPVPLAGVADEVGELHVVGRMTAALADGDDVVERGRPCHLAPHARIDYHMAELADPSVALADNVTRDAGPK